MEGCCLRWRRELIHCASRGREYPYPYSATVNSKVRRTVSLGEPAPCQRVGAVSRVVPGTL